jgi:hypothetical protein
MKAQSHANKNLVWDIGTCLPEGSLWAILLFNRIFIGLRWVFVNVMTANIFINWGREIQSSDQIDIYQKNLRISKNTFTKLNQISPDPNISYLGIGLIIYVDILIPIL